MIPLKPEVLAAYEEIRASARAEAGPGKNAAVADAVILVIRDLHQALVTIATAQASKIN